MGADYSFKVKNIEIWEPAFLKHNNSSVATVGDKSPIVLLLPQIWIVNYYVKCSSDKLSNVNKNTGLSREMIFQK